ncbi:hypothetical protein [Comamonas fluminis]|uniref:hypothetical protein n=1 Tax=Comamonas fluminis TaxID=2796366 RepID=UPI001C47643D|nr:hypothetical protein [Comamonas fluminis]
MNRCTISSLRPSPSRRLFSSALLAAAATGCLLTQVTLAQGLPSNDTRNFPPTAQFGELTITNFPEVAINGTAIRTTPGFRLFSQERTLVFASNYAGQKMLVGYVIEPQTEGLHTAWILTPAEIEKYKPIQPRSLLQRVFGS